MGGFSQTQAVMLLTVSLGKSNSAGAKPLSVKEWARFARWLKDRDLDPSDLMKGDLESHLADWSDRSITVQRLESLMAKGGALGLALEKWHRAGLWVMTRADVDYPERLKRRLRDESPPVLFGCGERQLLDPRGLAVVGSRDATDEDLQLAQSIGREASSQGYNLISGGARGIDQATMMGALESEGTAVGVLSDGLLRSATSARYRRHIQDGNLVLVSPSNPEAGFDVGRAMSRNRYIYCMADAAVVVSSSAGKGGTWNGAIEATKAGWVPVWVKPTQDSQSGNNQLINRGATALPDRPINLEDLFDGSHRMLREPVLPMALPLDTLETLSPLAAGPDEPNPEELPVGVLVTESSATCQDDPPDASDGQLVDGLSFYQFFLVHLAKLTTETPLSAAQISDRLDVNQRQVDTWLKQAQTANVVRKLNKPVRYEMNKDAGTQASLIAEIGE